MRGLTPNVAGGLEGRRADDTGPGADTSSVAAAPPTLPQDTATVDVTLLDDAAAVRGDASMASGTVLLLPLPSPAADWCPSFIG